MPPDKEGPSDIFWGRGPWIHTITRRVYNARIVRGTTIRDRPIIQKTVAYLNRPCAWGGTRTVYLHHMGRFLQGKSFIEHASTGRWCLSMPKSIECKPNSRNLNKQNCLGSGPCGTNLGAIRQSYSGRGWNTAQTLKYSQLIDLLHAGHAYSLVIPRVLCMLLRHCCGKVLDVKQWNNMK